MQLIGYQTECINRLYEELIHREHRFLSFSGPKGCGKSTIINELGDKLMENWKVFMISGTGETSPPYYTWYSATNKASISKRISSDISCGISFQPFGLPFGLNINAGLAKTDGPFSFNELGIIKAIQNEIGGKDNILFLADDFNSWDSSSKEFLMKLFDFQSVLGNDKRVHIILIDTAVSVEIPFGIAEEKIIKVHIDDIPLSDIEQIIIQQIDINMPKIDNLDHIIQFTGYDLRLISLAVQYQNDNSEINEIYSLNDLLEKRLLSITRNQQIICNTLEHVSIIKSFFSEKEAAFLLQEPPNQTERILDEAVNLNLIRKQGEYDFLNLDIKKYFEDRLDIKKKYLHHKFAQYLKLHYPEDYLSRSYHMFLSGNANSEQNQVEAAYLLVLEIIRRKEIIRTQESILDEKLKVISESLQPSIRHYVETNIQDFFEGCYELNQCNYRDAITKFEGLSQMHLSRMFLAEVKRLVLLSYVQLADNLNKIKSLANELYDDIMQVEFNEDELWCRSALLLMGVYSDKHVQIDRLRELKQEFQTRVNKYMYQSAFSELDNKYKMKSSMFFPSPMAIKLIEESCQHYRTYNNIPNLYLSLCNNTANRIICGEYVEAAKRLDECKEIITKNPSIRFPSMYKIENNIIINNFLQSEGELFEYTSRKRELIIDAAQDAAMSLREVRKQQGDETSLVIDFNLYSMLLLSGNFEEATILLRDLELKYKHLDEYYKYYYHNAYCAISIINGKYEEAKKHLASMESINSPLLSEFTVILNKRIYYLYKMIEEQYEGDVFNFNYEFVRRGIKVQDSSASFWGRGLLLSDLQFLSF